MSSIITNNSAMTALATLRNINRNLAETQQSISTGKTVANAKDNSAYWAIGAVMDSDVVGFKAVNESLSFADNAVGVARAGGEAITDLLKQIKGKLAAAVDGTTDATTIQADIDQLVLQIEQTIDASQFNGQNYLTTAPTGTGGDFLASLNRDSTGAVTPGYIDIGTVNGNSAEAEVATMLAAIQAYDATTNAAGDLSDIETQIATMTDVAAVFGQAGDRIEVAREFNKTVIDSLKAGIGAISDTDMEEASARLQALQVQQQLGSQSLGIANQQAQNILQLFR